jgi:Zn-dependent protease with chaperone function
MTVEVRILLVALAVFAGTGLIVAMLVPFVGVYWVKGTAAQRASRLSDLRLLPSMTALTASAIVAAAFLAFEPQWDGEDVGVVLPLLAAFATLLLGTAAWRGVQLIRTTRAAIGEWLRTAEPVSLPGISVRAYAISHEFPIVSVVGLHRPRLIIARSVLNSCSDAELRAMLAHEQGHIDRRDNLRRLLISIAPDILNWLPISETMFAAWREAAEEAADDEAVKCGADGRARLAAALVKVARLAAGTHHQSPMPASALYRGESLERRVRRLLDNSDGIASPPARPWPTWMTLGLLVAGALTVLQSVHGIFEGLIHSLP